MSDPARLTADLLRSMPLPSLAAGGDKETRGRVLVVGGGREAPGGALLAAEAALRAGAGKVQLATVQSIAPLFAARFPEARVTGLPETDEGEIAPAAVDGLRNAVEDCGALLIGPGMMREAAAEALVGPLLASAPEHGAVVDAVALCALRRAGTAGRGRLVITPHAGEMAKLLGLEKSEIEADPLAAAREATARLGCVTVMKGQHTNIVAPDGRSWLNVHGHVGLGTAGSGDTLAGMIAGLMARGAEPAVAALWGVFVHASAGERLGRRYGGIGYLARELPQAFAEVLGELSPVEDAPS